MTDGEEGRVGEEMVVQAGKGGVDVCVYDCFALVNGKEMKRKRGCLQNGAVAIRIIHTTKISTSPFTLLQE